MRSRLVLCLSVVVFAGLILSAASSPPEPPTAGNWDAAAAGRYLEGRVAFWQTWPNAQRDHDTACVSCHTILPYAIARPALQSTASPFVGTPSERHMLANVARRTTMWRDVEPFYPDQTRGIPKSSESRGTESVLNAAILSTRDSSTKMLADDTRQALSNMWALQMRTGNLKGAWAWLNFGLEPWEGPASSYFGASIAAIAVARAPGAYAGTADIQPQLTLLKEYLRAGAETESLFNKLMILWASGELPGVLDSARQKKVHDAALAAQNKDGGWSMAALAPWKRLDNTTIDAGSDGFATALATLALLESGVPTSSAPMRAARAWLVSHQDPKSGALPAMSVNRLRDPGTEPGRFMTDAATGYAVLALARDWN
jgi:squalene-hopene/tetraprenyl-beta-curcumene cyclase